MKNVLDIAIKELGVHETPGPAATARIVEYDKSTTLRATSDEVPWCSSFVNWVVKQAGMDGTNSAAAISWSEWGREVGAEASKDYGPEANQEPGDIVVFEWSGGGHHVAFYVGEGERDGEYMVQVLGGNQHDSVSYAWYPWDDIINIRRK